MSIASWLLKKGGQQLAKKGIIKSIPSLEDELKIKNLNEGEDEYIEEFKNPNSPMHKDVSEWTDWDKYRAEHSPSYKNNKELQDKVKNYNKTIIEKHLQDWEKRNRLRNRYSF